MDSTGPARELAAAAVLPLPGLVFAGISLALALAYALAGLAS